MARSVLWPRSNSEIVQSDLSMLSLVALLGPLSLCKLLGPLLVLCYLGYYYIVMSFQAINTISLFLFFTSSSFFVLLRVMNPK